MSKLRVVFIVAKSINVIEEIKFHLFKKILCIIYRHNQTLIISSTIKSLSVKKKANQKLNARMTESVCYVITSQLFSVLRSRIGRSSSWRLGGARAWSCARARASWRATSGARASTGGSVRPWLLRPPFPASSPRLPRSHIIYDSIRARSKLAILSTNNNSFFLSRHFIFLRSYSVFNSLTRIQDKLPSEIVVLNKVGSMTKYFSFTNRKQHNYKVQTNFSYYEPTHIERRRQALIKQYATFTDLRKQTTQSFRRRAA